MNEQSDYGRLTLDLKQCKYFFSIYLIASNIQQINLNFTNYIHKGITNLADVKSNYAFKHLKNEIKEVTINTTIEI